MDILYKTNINKIQKCGDKKEDWLATSGHKKQNGNVFPGFSFCLTYSDWVQEK